MRLFFGRRKEEEQQEAELDLPTAIMKNREAIGTLEKRHIHIEKKIQVQENEARQRIHNKDKRGAMLALRRKKMYESELESLENSRLTLEQQIITLESAQTQQVAVGALTTGVQAQKQINNQMNVNKIDKLMEDLQEQQDQQKEVSQVLQQGTPMMDDDELMAELEQLEASELDSQLAAASVPSQPMPGYVPAAASTVPATTASPPAAPSVLPRSTVLSDEEQLKALMGELA
eukprot:GHVS01011565.1.p1 GENE.GHVS01011565.1~~GHVS01011565.1.p1  ORF type:complete len:232 (-),score=66.38 GHVS01011565.1:94-789(-)